MQHLREVILQDACLLIDMFPGLKIWQHQIFRSRAFLEYKHRLIQTIQTSQDPILNRLERAIPELVPRIVAMNQSIHQKLEYLSGKIEEVAQRTETKVDSIFADGHFELSKEFTED